MSKITVRCEAKDRETCPYHGAFDHARINLSEVKENYTQAEKVLADEGSAPTVTSQNKVRSLRSKLNRAQAEYDAFPSPMKKLKKELEEAKKNLDTETTARLSNRIKRATSVVNARKQAKKQSAEADKIAKQAKTEFEKWKEDHEAAKAISDEPAWKQGYREAMGNILIQKGEFTGASAVKMTLPNWGALSKRYSSHISDCGVYNTSNLYEDFEVYTEAGYYGDEAGVEKTTCAEVTCNCGEVFGATVSFPGGISEMTEGSHLSI